MGEEIGDIKRQHVVTQLSAEQAEALTLLYTDQGIDRTLSGIAFRFRQNKDDLRQELALKLSREGYTLRDVKCLKKWCGVAATNICNNEYRHEKTVWRHREACLNENIQGKMRGGAIVLQRSAVKTPEQQMLEQELGQEREAQLQARINEIVGRLYDIFDSLPKDVLEIAKLWAEGKTPAEITKAVGKSIATVYRKHKEFQRVIVERIGTWNAATDESMVVELEPLISHSLRSLPRSR